MKHDYDSETVDGKATLEAYSDGSYTLKNYYTEGGSDLTFTVSDGTITITNGSNNYLYNVSGPEAVDIIYYYDGEYSSFDGTKHKEVFIFTIFTMLMAKLMALDCTTILFGLLPPHQFLL